MTSLKLKLIFFASAVFVAVTTTYLYDMVIHSMTGIGYINTPEPIMGIIPAWVMIWLSLGIIAVFFLVSSMEGDEE